jgi:predicted permease
VTALRRAWRSLVRSPGFALGAAATFALGIGINIAVFSSVDRMLFRPLPYRDADRLFLIQQIDLDSGQRVNLPARYAMEAKAQLDFIEELAILGDSTGYFMGPDGDGPEVRVSMVTSKMLEVGGIRPVMGRDFTDEDDRFQRRVAILTHEGWQARFASDPNVLGRRIWYRDTSLEIIGVLPPGFIVPGTFIDPNISGIALMPTRTFALNGVPRIAPPTVRVKSGTSRESAQAALDTLVDRIRPEIPPEKHGPQAVQIIPIREAMFGQYFRYLWLVAGGAALVLVIACANLAGLFLVRGRARLKAAAVRLSLGASRARIAGEAMMEGALVCVAGTVTALLALAWAGRALQSVLPAIFSRFSAGLDLRVVTFAIATTILVSLLASLVPAYLLSRGDVWRAVHSGVGPLGGGSPRRGRWLLALEAAVGVVLVAGAVVAARNLAGLTSAGIGFDPGNRHLLLITTRSKTAADRYADLQQALAIVRGLPGVVSAAGAPMLSVLRTGTAPFSSSGPPCCRWQVTGDYVGTMGIPLLAGRDITDADVLTRAPVALLNQLALARVWPGVRAADAIGRPLRLDGEPDREIVGIVGDTRRGHDDDPLPGVFVPVVSDPFGGMLIVARTQPGVPLLVSRVRPAVETAGRRELLYIRPMAPMYDRALEAPRFRAMLFGLFGIVALVIAMVGLYALTSFEVTSRRSELGVRIALGASRRAVLRLVLVDSSKPVVVGLIAGLGVAAWAAPFLQSFLHRMNARDPWMLAVAAAALLGASLAAAWLPAWRATRVNPVDVLRQT